MNAPALKIFCDVVRLRSFSDAAVQNQITQAAVSQNVMQLEKKLGVQLIDRTKRPFQLTHEGTVYYEGCQELVDRYFAIEKEVKTLQGEISGTVRVAAIYSAGLAEISHIVQRFTQEYPNCSVGLSFLHPHKVYDSVLNDEAELGIVSYPRLRHELTSTPWRNEKMKVICAKNSEFSGKSSISFSEMAGQKFIGFNSDLLIRKEIDRFLRRHSVDPEVVMEFDNVETIKRAVEIGQGLAIVPEPTIATEERNGTLSSMSMPPPGLVRPLGIVSRKNRVFFRAADVFIEMVQAESRLYSPKQAA